MFYWRHQIEPASSGELGIDWGFTSATGPRQEADALDYGAFNLGGHVGDDPGLVEANRGELAAAVAVPREHLIFMAQTHGTTVVQVDGPWQGDPPQADAIVSTSPDLALAVLVADCVPLLLADVGAGVVAAVHAGRPGMIAGIVPRTLDVMADAGASRIIAAVGPSVCGRCYEVPSDMRDEAARTSAVSATVSWSGTPAIDVAAGVVDQLHGAGVAVTWIPGCTRESDRLYSYRRRATTGRFAGVIRRWGR